MKIIKPYFVIETPIDSKTILKHIERCGRTCYKSENKITEDSAKGFVKMLIRSGHESVIEHFCITVRFICDRGVSHELVRHRLASFSQESTRYCNYGRNDEITFILPSWIQKGEGKYSPVWEGCLGGHEVDPFKHGSPESRWFWHCAITERDYLQLLGLGWTPQEARSVLSNSVKTEVVMTADLREWRTVFKQRTSKAAHPQMRELAIPLLNEFQRLIPIIFDDIEVTE